MPLSSSLPAIITTGPGRCSTYCGWNKEATDHAGSPCEQCGGTRYSVLSTQYSAPLPPSFAAAAVPAPPARTAYRRSAVRLLLPTGLRVAGVAGPGTDALPGAQRCVRPAPLLLRLGRGAGLFRADPA